MQKRLPADERVTLLNLNGQIIGRRFKLMRRITCGSYSEIYPAANLSPKDDEPESVVIKVLNLGLRGQLESELERTLIENFHVEAWSLAHLRHPHIVRLYDAGETTDQHTGRGLYYLVLERLTGGDLYNFCRAAPLSLEHAVVYLGQLCSALSCVHACGIVHRDIKPNNCMLEDDRRALKLLDFGTAHLLDAQNGLVTRVGTDVYSAPESYSPHEGVTITAAADVYSLSKLLLFILTGDSPAHLAQKQITSLPASIASKPWAPRLLNALFKATSENPKERQQSVEEFHAELQRVLELTEVSKRAFENRQPEDQGSHRSPKHTRFEVPVPAVSAGAAILSWGQFEVGGFMGGFISNIRQALVNVPRQLFVQILMVVLGTSALLIGLPRILSLRPPSVPAAATQTPADPLIGKEAQALTDLNIRSGPSADQPKIGLAEKWSHVRIVSYSDDRNWYEIQVNAHGRAKIDPKSLDRGWVRSRFLTIE